MEWIKYSNESKPTMNKEYLCIVVIPGSHGKYYTSVRSLYYSDYNEWNCDDMIIAYWTEIPELPKEIVL